MVHSRETKTSRLIAHKNAIYQAPSLQQMSYSTYDICPSCHGEVVFAVVDSRPASRNLWRRRRHRCPKCRYSFSSIQVPIEELEALLSTSDALARLSHQLEAAQELVRQTQEIVNNHEPKHTGHRKDVVPRSAEEQRATHEPGVVDLSRDLDDRRSSLVHRGTKGR